MGIVKSAGLRIDAADAIGEAMLVMLLAACFIS